MAHTSGPWTISGDAIVARESGYVVMWVYAAVKCGREGDDYYSCKPPSLVITVRWRSSEDLALALAAPDLLDVLKAFVAETVDYMATNKLGDPEGQHNVKWARKVIAKAEGQS